jgi:hypothetical protein
MLTLCELILGAWFLVSPETVEKSFKVTGISSEMDGSENLLINDIDNGN